MNPFPPLPIVYDPITVTVVSPYPLPYGAVMAIFYMLLLIPTFILIEYLIVSRAGRISLVLVASVNVLTFIGAEVFSVVVIGYIDPLVIVALLVIEELLIGLIESMVYLLSLNEAGLIRSIEDCFRVVWLTVVANYASFAYGVLVYLVYVATRMSGLIGDIATLGVLLAIFTFVIGKAKPLILGEMDAARASRVRI